MIAMCTVQISNYKWGREVVLYIANTLEEYKKKS